MGDGMRGEEKTAWTMVEGGGKAQRLTTKSRRHKEHGADDENPRPACAATAEWARSGRLGETSLPRSRHRGRPTTTDCAASGDAAYSGRGGKRGACPTRRIAPREGCADGKYSARLVELGSRPTTAGGQNGKRGSARSVGVLERGERGGRAPRLQWRGRTRKGRGYHANDTAGSERRVGPRGLQRRGNSVRRR